MAGPGTALFLARRYLGARREESFISVVAAFSLAGIALGVGTLIVVLSVMGGFRVELLRRILDLNGHIAVIPDRPDPDVDAMSAAIMAIPGVVAVSPVLQAELLVGHGAAVAGAFIRAMPADAIGQRPLLRRHIGADAMAGFRAGNGLLVGARLAERLGAGPGDAIDLMSPHGRVTLFGTAPRVKAYPVLGHFEVGMYDFDNSVILMPLALARTWFRTGANGISELQVLIDNPDAAGTVSKRIAAAVGDQARSIDWRRSNSAFFATLDVQRNIMFLILSIAVIVAAFSIVSGLIMLVNEKTRAIAILRTMGASRRTIRRVFVIVGLTAGGAGTALGVGLGILFARHIEPVRRWLEDLTGVTLFDHAVYFLEEMPVRIDPAEIARVALMAVVLCFVATLYPAWRATRIDPAAALRDE